MPRTSAQLAEDYVLHRQAEYAPLTAALYATRKETVRYLIQMETQAADALLEAERVKAELRGALS
jgi:hypothetical protein